MTGTPHSPEPTWHTDPPGTRLYILAIAIGCLLAIVLIIGLPWWLTS